MCLVHFTVSVHFLSYHYHVQEILKKNCNPYLFSSPYLTLLNLFLATIYLFLNTDSGMPAVVVLDQDAFGDDQLVDRKSVV